LLHEGSRHVLEDTGKVYLLLIVTAQGRTRLLAGDSEQRHMVQARVIHAGEQMRGTWTGGGNTDPEPSGELGVGRGHERCHFFMSGLYESYFLRIPIHCPEDAVDSVARVPEDYTYTPFRQAFPEKVPDGLSHKIPLATIGQVKHPDLIL
jgi:hypothetical protein